MKRKTLLRLLVALLIIVALNALDIIEIPSLYIPPGFGIILVLFLILVFLLVSQMLT